jgi:peptidoglycan/LPS O-acetylase OafA/YrhL
LDVFIEEVYEESIGGRFEVLCIWIFQKNFSRRMLYLAGVGIVLGVNFSVHQLDEYGKEYWPSWVKVAYFVLHHAGYGLGVSCWMLPFLMGHCSVINKVLSLGFFQVFARISYSLYMVHSAIYFLVILSTSHSIVFDDFFIFFSACSLLAVSIVVAFLVSATVEFPFLSLERKYLRD